MWKRVRERLPSGVEGLFVIAWLAGALVIAAGVLGLTGTDVGRSGLLGLTTVIFLVPIGVLVALDELVIRRIRYGPPVPGRRKRRGLGTEQVRSLDQRLKRRSGDSSDPKSAPARTHSSAAVRAFADRPIFVLALHNGVVATTSVGPLLVWVHST